MAEKRTGATRFDVQSGTDPEHERWLALGGDDPIALPEDIKVRSEDAPRMRGERDRLEYVESLVPDVRADYGNNDRDSYEREKARLDTALSSAALSASDKRKVQMLRDDLDDHFRDEAGQWYAEDLRNASSNEEASNILAKMEALEAPTGRPTRDKIALDIYLGGTGFGDEGWSSERPSGVLGDDPIAGVLWDRSQDTYGSAGSVYDQVGEQILGNTRLRGQQQLGYYDQGANRAITGLRGANDRATQQTQDAIAALEASGQYTKDEIDALLDGLDGTRRDVEDQSRDALDQFEGAYDRFGSERDAATRQYLDALSPLERQLQAQGYEGVSTSAEDINRLLDGFGKQEDVYGRYEELSTPEMTAKERAILDAAGRSFAQKDKGARDASIRDLGDRGILSGGNLISSQVASQQQLGNERAAAMVAAQGSAVDRALAALAGMRGTAADMGTSANQIRTGNDAMAQFNKNQQGITQRFQDEFQQAEMERQQRLAQGRQDTLLDKTTGDLNAAGTLNSAQQTALDNRFDRKNTVTNTGLTATKNKYAIDEGITGEKTSAADREADRAGTLAGTELTNVTNRTNLIGSTGKDEDEALKYLLGLQDEKLDLKNLGVGV